VGRGAQITIGVGMGPRWSVWGSAHHQFTVSIGNKQLCVYIEREQLHSLKEVFVGDKQLHPLLVNGLDRSNGHKIFPNTANQSLGTKLDLPKVDGR
jgi:hypothetical protein